MTWDHFERGSLDRSTAATPNTTIGDKRLCMKGTTSSLRKLDMVVIVKESC